MSIFKGLGLSLLVLASTAQAQTCFGDVQLAYQHLLRTQSQTARTININTASVAELTDLSGVGTKTAEQIVLYRQTMGRFDSIDELAQVKGIGEKTLAKNRHRLTVHD